VAGSIDKFPIEKKFQPSAYC